MSEPGVGSKEFRSWFCGFLAPFVVFVPLLFMKVFYWYNRWRKHCYSPVSGWFVDCPSSAFLLCSQLYGSVFLLSLGLGAERTFCLYDTIQYDITRGATMSYVQVRA